MYLRRARGEETILKCNYNGDEDEYSSKDVFYVKTTQKVELKKGDTMTIFHFGNPEGKDGHYEIKVSTCNQAQYREIKYEKKTSTALITACRGFILLFIFDIKYIYFFSPRPKVILDSSHCFVCNRICSFSTIF